MKGERRRILVISQDLRFSRGGSDESLMSPRTHNIRRSCGIASYRTHRTTKVYILIEALRTTAASYDPAPVASAETGANPPVRTEGATVLGCPLASLVRRAGGTRP